MLNFQGQIDTAGLRGDRGEARVVNDFKSNITFVY